MTARLGIELSPSSCRIVELDGDMANGREGRVRSFAVLPPAGEETRAKLQSLRRRTAAVVVWNAPAEHRQVVVTGGTYESMRAEALASLAAAGLQTTGAAADLAPTVGRPRRGMRQPVIVALAASDELAAALEPLRAAGIRLRSVTTPAAALASIARRRRAFSVPGAIEAYVALEDTATCIALVRDAVLVAAQNLTWGYAEGATGLARSRDEIAAQLADAITRFVGAISGGSREVGQVCICGGLPELRSMTLPLMERLDVEVEPLDSLFGIDAARLPEAADEFRERSVELRLAWAAAADWPAPIDLLRAQRRRTSRLVLARAAVAAGVIAGLALGWRVEQSQWWRSLGSMGPRPQARGATNTAARGRAAGAPPVTPGRPVPPRATAPPATQPQTTVARNAPTPTPPVAQNKPAAPAPTPPVAQRGAPFVVPPDVGPQLPPTALRPAPSARPTPPPAVAQAPPRLPAPTPPVAAPPATANPPAARNEPPAQPRRDSAPAARIEPMPSRAAVPPVRGEPPPQLRTEPPVANRVEPAAPNRAAAPAPGRAEPPAPTRAEGPRAEPAAPRRPAAAHVQPAPQEVALPFDAVLGTILYASDRKLAIVDGRIVGVGDQVRGARITGITPSSVLLRDAQGRLRQLTLGAGGR